MVRPILPAPVEWLPGCCQAAPRPGTPQGGTTSHRKRLFRKALRIMGFEIFFRTY